MENKFIIEPFNGVFFAVFAVMLAGFLICCATARKMSEDGRKKFLTAIMLASLVIYVLYKFALANDAAYSVILDEYGKDGFTWWSELPLQLCNINLLVLPAALILNKRSLMSFCFFAGPLGALMAIVMPTIGFGGYSIFLLRNLGYYFTHWMVFFGGLSLAGFGIYKPKYKDIIPALISSIVLAAAVFCVDLILVKTGVNVHANYFFAMSPDGNPILEILRGIIPVDFVYLLPLCLVFLPYMYLITWCFALAEKMKK